MKTNDLNRIGTTYNIIDQNGLPVRDIRIVKQEDILSLALGEYSEIAYLDFEDYVAQSTERLTGFVEDPLKVYWHTCSEDQYQLTDIIDVCIKHDYTTVIVEIIQDDLLDFDMY